MKRASQYAIRLQSEVPAATRTVIDPGALAQVEADATVFAGFHVNRHGMFDARAGIAEGELVMAGAETVSQ